MTQLIAESGIDPAVSALTKSAIATYIADNPRLIEDWLKWSGWKRVLSGWYFIRRSEDYVVGFHPTGEILTCSSPAVACAEFIVREVEALMAVPNSK